MPTASPRTAGEYHPVNCVYNVGVGVTGMGASDDQFTVSIMRVPGDRLFVTTDSKRTGASGAMIDKKGKEYDFNLDTDPKKGPTVLGTPINMPKEQYDAIAEQQKKHTLKLLDPHIINFLTIVIPDFSAASLQPGTVVAHAKMEGDDTWADFYYRGSVPYQGRDAAPLFDLVRVNGTGRTGLYGFILWDNEHWVPLIMRVNLGLYTLKATMNTCQRSS